MDIDLWKQRFRDWLELEFASADTVSNQVQGLRLFWQLIQTQKIESWTEVTRDFVDEYRAQLFCEKHKRTGQPLATGTHIARIVAVKTFFRFLVAEGFLLHDPAAHLEYPKHRLALPAVLSEPEIERLMQTPEVATGAGLRDRTLLELLYGTALRNSEICSLTLEQVDLGQHLVRLQKGKGNKGRVVPIGQEAQSWLELYLEKVRPGWLRNPSLTAIFLDRWGHRALSRGGLTQIVRELGRQAELGKVVTPHTLRHSCATHMLRRGAGLRQVQKLLGHEQLSSTEHYTRVEVSDLRRMLRLHHPRA